MKKFDELKVKIFADGADKDSMLKMSKKPFIKGLTTNPTLMRKANVKNYKKFAQEILHEIRDISISFEVFSDDFEEMEKQALEIASWGNNAYVKIPITNTKMETCYSLVERLAAKGVKLNITAIMTLDQVRKTTESLNSNVPSYVSVFAGRIADTGRDPMPMISNAVDIVKSNPASEIIWASTRELYNIFQADQVGCHIITVTNDLINKMHLFGYDLDEFSLETVKMFYADALAAGYDI